MYRSISIENSCIIVKMRSQLIVVKLQLSKIPLTIFDLIKKIDENFNKSSVWREIDIGRNL